MSLGGGGSATVERGVHCSPILETAVSAWLRGNISADADTTGFDGREVDAKIVRYNIARLRLGQLLLPIAVVTTVAARRFPSLFTALLAIGVQASALTLFLSAARRFGWQRVVREDGGLSIGSTDARIERHRVHRWTINNGLARLYGLEQSYKLRARNGADGELSAFLSRCFGPPLTLRRRGSFRARMLALGVALCGLVGGALAIGVGITWLAVVSPLALIFGIATLGALSQRTT